MMGPRRHLRRGIFLLPTLFTVGNLFCGFSSLIQSGRGLFEFAAVLIVAAAALDGLDGRLARMTGTTTAFGKEFDSLADIVSFGVAPAMLTYHWALAPAGRIGWLVAFVFVACAAMRLARFNIRQSGIADRRHFAGLPSPMAGCAIAAIVFAFPEAPQTQWLRIGAGSGIIALASLMTARLRYRSFKEFDLRHRRSPAWVLAISAFIAIFAFHAESVLLLLIVGYVLSAPLAYGWAVTRRGGATSVTDTEVVDEPVR